MFNTYKILLQVDKGRCQILNLHMITQGLWSMGSIYKKSCGLKKFCYEQTLEKMAMEKGQEMRNEGNHDPRTDLVVTPQKCSAKLLLRP